MNYKTAFGSFLKTEDLEGRPKKVTIEKVEEEELKSDKGVENKLVVRFVGIDKGLVLNRTNADSIAEIAASDETTDWKGQEVELYPDKTRFGNKTVDCIRIRSAVPF